MRPSARCWPSLSPGSVQKNQEIIGALGNICHSETPDKESFFRDAKFYKIDDEILEAEKKMYAAFVLCADKVTWLFQRCLG